MSRINWAIGLGLVWLCCAPILGWGQREVSLSEAIEETLDNNFDIQIVERSAEVVANNNHWGTAGKYPSVAFSLSSNNGRVTISNPVSFINGTYTSIGGSGTLNLAWNLFSGHRVRISKARLEELEKLSLGNVALVVENTLQAVILQYYTCLIEAERLLSLEVNLSLSRDRMEYVRSERGLGIGTTFDLLTVENAYLSDSSSLLLQQLNLDNARRQLGLLMGLPPAEDVIPVDELPAVFPLYDRSLLRSKMLSDNQTLKNQFINLELARKGVGLAEAGLYPAINLDVGNSSSLSLVALEGTGIIPGVQLNYYANFSLNFTLYNGGQVKRSIENAKIDELVAQMGIDQLKQSMDYQLVNSLALYESRLQMLALQEALVSSGKEQLEIAELKFRNGTLSSFNFREVQVAYLNSTLARSQAQYNLLEAKTNLTRLIGGILDARPFK